MKHRLVLYVAVGLIATPALAPAQVQRSGGGEAQKFMQQYQQMAAEKSALQAQVVLMKKDLEAATAGLAAMKKERDALKAHPVGPAPAVVAQLTTSKEAAERNADVFKRRFTELEAKFRELAGNLREAEADRAKLRNDAAVKNAAFDKCADSNQQLFELNGAILKRFEHVGLFTRASADEPFTRITRNRLDNLVVETRERAQELRLNKQQP